jgi:hypothetical protein
MLRTWVFGALRQIKNRAGPVAPASIGQMIYQLRSSYENHTFFFIFHHQHEAEGHWLLLWPP